MRLHRRGCERRHGGLVSSIGELRQLARQRKRGGKAKNPDNLAGHLGERRIPKGGKVRLDGPDRCLIFGARHQARGIAVRLHRLYVCIPGLAHAQGEAPLVQQALGRIVVDGELVPLSPLGVVIGVVAANAISQRALELIFAGLALVIGMQLVLRAVRAPEPP